MQIDLSIHRPETMTAKTIKVGLESENKRCLSVDLSDKVELNLYFEDGVKAVRLAQAINEIFND